MTKPKPMNDCPLFQVYVPESKSVEEFTINRLRRKYPKNDGTYVSHLLTYIEKFHQAFGKYTEADFIKRMEIISKVFEELDRAYAKHGSDQWGPHEFYAIMKEEVDEVWDDIKRDAPEEDLMKEIIQVMCVCLRYAETGNRYGSKK